MRRRRIEMSAIERLWQGAELVTEQLIVATGERERAEAQTEAAEERKKELAAIDAAVRLGELSEEEGERQRREILTAAAEAQERFGRADALVAELQGRQVAAAEELVAALNREALLPVQKARARVEEAQQMVADRERELAAERAGYEQRKEEIKQVLLRFDPGERAREQERQQRFQQDLKRLFWLTPAQHRAEGRTPEEIAEIERLKDEHNRRARERAAPFTKEAAARRQAAQKEEALASEAETWRMLPESAEER